MFTLPVMLDTFYQVSVAGILWNLVVIPLLPIVIASGGMGLRALKSISVDRADL